MDGVANSSTGIGDERTCLEHECGTDGGVGGLEPHPLSQRPSLARVERSPDAGREELLDSLPRELEDKVASGDEGEEFAARFEPDRVEDPPSLDVGVAVADLRGHHLDHVLAGHRARGSSSLRCAWRGGDDGPELGGVEDETGRVQATVADRVPLAHQDGASAGWCLEPELVER